MKFSSRIEVRRRNVINKIQSLVFKVTKPVKLIGILSVLFLIWLLYSYNDSSRAVPPSNTNLKTTHDESGENQMDVPTLAPPPPPSPRVVVDVYYECLCPDSRYFVLHELLPTYQKVGSIMDVRMWPYGKATSEPTTDGELGVREIVNLCLTSRLWRILLPVPARPGWVSGEHIPRLCCRESRGAGQGAGHDQVHDQWQFPARGER